MSPEPTGTSRFTVGVIGARGYTGAELVRLVCHHPRLALAFASSSTTMGQPLTSVVAEAPADLTFAHYTPDTLDRAPQADVIVLALHDGASHAYAEALANLQPDAVVLDIGSDHRFNDNWVYGLAEHNHERLRHARRIANPGCYATAMQLALRPIRDALASVPCCFGVSGYSGAGAKPSERNDPEVLRDNILPYKLTNHTHEREVSFRLGRDVRFVPHVASFFRGINLTILVDLQQPITLDALLRTYRDFYREHPLIAVREEIPHVRDIVGRPGAEIGGFSIDPKNPRRITVVATLDNLLKGAASQAVQNINLALGLPMNEGVT